MAFDIANIGLNGQMFTTVALKLGKKHVPFCKKREHFYSAQPGTSVLEAAARTNKPAARHILL